MTLTEYLNQQQPIKTYSVTLNSTEYQAYYDSLGVLGIHIYAFPDASYLLNNTAGYITTLKGKNTIFRIDMTELDFLQLPKNFKFKCT